MKSDKELLASLSRHLRNSGRTARRSFEAITLQAPLPEFDGPAEIGRAVELAEAKWFVDRVVRSEGTIGPKWTFDLTGRGAEALDLD